MVIGAKNFENNDLWYVQARQIANGKIVPNSAIENLLMMDVYAGSARHISIIGALPLSCRCFMRNTGSLDTPLPRF